MKINMLPLELSVIQFVDYRGQDKQAAFALVKETLMHRTAVVALTALVVCCLSLSGQAPAKKGPREALAPFNDLIGTWRAVGTPAGTREEQQKGFWNENMSWEWKFKGPDAWLEVVFKDSKNFTAGELRYDPAKDNFLFTVKK